MTPRRVRHCLAILTVLAPVFWLAPARPEAGPSADTAAKVPRPGKVERIRNIDFLFEALKIAPDAETARLIENRIWQLWLASGSDTADLLMSRVKTAMDEKNVDLAIRLLDAVIELKPDYVEGWNRRATLYFQKRDYEHAMSDLAQVLKREPRHFGALTGLGMILEDIGDDKQALDVFRKALEVDPHLDKVPDLVKELREKVEGRDI